MLDFEFSATELMESPMAGRGEGHTIELEHSWSMEIQLRADDDG